MWRVVEMQPVRGKRWWYNQFYCAVRIFFRLVVIHPICRPYERIAIRMHFSSLIPYFVLFFSLLKIIRLQSELRGVTFLLTFPWYNNKRWKEQVVLLQKFLPVCHQTPPPPIPIPFSFPWCCFNMEFHQAQCTLADLILPWHSSSAKSTQGLCCQGIQPCLDIILEIKQHLLCSGPSSWLAGDFCSLERGAAISACSKWWDLSSFFFWI